MIYDLHQDISIELLNNGVDHFIEHKRILKPKTGKYSKYGIISQVNLLKLQKGEYRVVVGASCALDLTERGILVPINPYKELSKHINSYLNLSNYINKIQIIKTKSEFNNLLTDKLGIILSVEGVYFINNSNDFRLIDNVYKKGVRIIGPFWNIDNSLGGGGLSKEGLSELGINLVKYLNEKGIIIDVTHSSPLSLKNIIRYSSKPVIYSHTLANGIYKNHRNITDEQIRMICNRNGLIGVCFIRDFSGSNNIASIVKHIKYLLKVGSSDNLCIGSDFGAMSKKQTIKQLESAENIIHLVYAMEKNGINNRITEKIFWKNTHSFLKNNLI